jgi:ppGpp synthetase/RelA/SpoT-type nucleotidyltranferase
MNRPPKTSDKALLEEYDKKRVLYGQIAEDVFHTLISSIGDAKIRIRSIEYRTKTPESFYEKIKRMDSAHKFLENITDLAGVRVICFSQTDVNKIDRIIGSVFDVVENDKQKIGMKDRGFVYNSRHYVVHLRSNLKEPSYDKIRNLKCEIQVRTVLADALSSILSEQYNDKSSELSKDIQEELQQIPYLRKSYIKETDEYKTAIDSYGALISKSANEPEFQKFFEQNAVFLDPKVTKTYPKPDLGGELIPDFMLVLHDSSYLFVEIEKPNVKLFDKKGNPTAVFTHAHQQIRDYLKWVANNKAFLRERKCANLTGDNFKGLLVIGRTCDLSSKEIECLENINAEVRGKYEIKTFDKILDENETLLRNIKKYTK